MLTKRMAMRRMNEMCRRMALTLVFYVLLFNTCKGQSSDSPQTAISLSTDNSIQASPTVNAIPVNLTDKPATNVTEKQNTTETQTISPTAMTTNGDTTQKSFLKSFHTSEPLSRNNNAKSDVTTNDEHISEETADNANQSPPKPDQSEEPEQAPVFVPLLLSGLILAAILIGLYVWKYHCHAKAKGIKLAEDPCMVDEENQGNTLVSVAPLNPPESQEKPSQNGESLEVVKTQNPPGATNGHSTTKADTEL